MNPLRNAEQKMFCICVNVYKIYKGDDYDKISKVLSTLKNKKLNINNILIKKYKDLLENPNFEQNHYSKSSTGIYKIPRDIITLMKWVCYSDRSYYENINFYDLMGSILSCLNEIP